MKLRRIFGLLTAFCLFVGLSLPARAADADIAALEQDIIDACIYHRETDISDYDIFADDLAELYYRLYDEGKLPWYVADGFEYSYTDNDVALSILPDLLYEGEVDMSAYEEAVAQVLDACVFPGMSQWQIALSVHDYLIANTAYDETEEKNSGYDILVNRTAMCAGYAEAYQDLLQRAGIDCMVVSSDEMEHAWNLVCIDGNWYHADLTWDDPTPDTAGYVCHEYFLLTDTEISAGDDPHYGWVTDITCVDTRFSEAFWKNVYGQICYESKDTCYLIRADDFVNSIYRRDENTGAETQLYKETTQSIDIGYGNYRYEHTGLTLRGGRLWFNTLNKLLSMKTDGTDLQTEYSHSGNTYLYGSHVSADQIHLTFMDHDGNGTPHALETAIVDHIHSFTRTVTDPTCTEDGYTRSVCDCGLEATGALKAALGHDYTVTQEQKATLTAAGSNAYTCQVCGDSYTETVPQLTFLAFLKENGRLVLLVVALLICLPKMLSKKKKQKYGPC